MPITEWGFMSGAGLKESLGSALEDFRPTRMRDGREGERVVKDVMSSLLSRPVSKVTK